MSAYTDNERYQPFTQESSEISYPDWRESFSKQDVIERPSRKSIPDIPIRIKISLNSHVEDSLFEFSLDSLDQKLYQLFKDECVEDGRTHPAEKVIEQMLWNHPLAKNAITKLVQSNNNTYRIEILRTLGRLPISVVSGWGESLMAEMLQSNDVVLRDAAIRALELWETPQSIGVLQSHQEESSWLRDYIDRVLDAINR